MSQKENGQLVFQILELASEKKKEIVPNQEIVRYINGSDFEEIIPRKADMLVIEVL